MTIRVLVVDDHALFREGVKRTLAETTDIKVVGEAADGHAAAELARSLDFEVLLTDLSIPLRSGMDLVRHVRAHRPSIRILVLSMHAETEYAVRAMRGGANGYLTKESAPDELAHALRKVAAGGSFISANVAQELALGTMTSQKSAHEALTGREFQIFTLLAAGVPIGRVAEQLHLSPKTVSAHKVNVMQKLGAASQTDLVRYALKHGLTRPLEP